MRMIECMIRLALALASGIAMGSSVPRDEAASIQLFGNAESYDVETTVMLNDVARRDKEVAYKLKASLDVEPVWSGSDTEFLLKFELARPRLLSRGSHPNADFLPRDSVWDAYPHSLFYAHWKHGLVLAVHLDLDELPDVVNYKRSLVGLFQLQVVDGEASEADVSGACNVTYETLSAHTIRKIKSGCPGEWGETRRVTRYSLGATRRHVHEVHAEEVHEARSAGGGLKARAWHRLLHSASRAAAPAARSLADALAAMPAWLAPAALHDSPPEAQIRFDDEELELEAALAASGALWDVDAAGAGGTADEARAALLTLPALCVAPVARLAALLQDRVDEARLASLVRALGTCGSAHAHAAVSALLPLHAAAEPPSGPLLALAADYLAALALALNPDESVVEDSLKLGAWPTAGGGEGAAEALAASALAAAASGARRLRDNVPASRTPSAVREHLLAALDACSEERCRVAHLRALGNLAAAETVDALLRWAERGDGAEGPAALDALESLSAATMLRPERLRRLECIAASGRPLPVRAAALDLLLRLTADAPFGLLRLAHALLHQEETELVRLLWQRLEALSDTHEAVLPLLLALPTGVRARASLAPGTSTVLSRFAGAVGDWRARLDSVQVARSGALQRGLVRLHTLAPGGSDDTISVEVQASGLEAFAGSSESSERDEPLGAALALGVGGVRLPAVSLFSGQAELLAHVWAGTASSPTPVLRALRPLPPASRSLRLLDGTVLRLHRHAVATVALDAHAQVSLWSRNARAALEVRAGVVERTRAVVRAAWGSLNAVDELALEPRLRLAADLDFYDGVALCVRVRTPLHESRCRLALDSALGAPARSVRRSRLRSWGMPARTLALGAQNDAACCTLVSAED